MENKSIDATWQHSVNARTSAKWEVNTVKFNESSLCPFFFLMNIPLLVSGQALDVLRVAVGGARDSCCRHPCGSCARSRRHLHAEVREDPDHPRSVQRAAERVCVRVCECSLSSGRAKSQRNPISVEHELLGHSHAAVRWAEAAAAAAAWRLAVAVRGCSAETSRYASTTKVSTGCWKACPFTT